jgi:hypothetical protein
MSSFDNSLNTNVQINNCVDFKKLTNDSTWIHGLPESTIKDIQITVFVISIENIQLEYCIQSINNLPLDIPILVNVIMNISPTAKAYNEMVVRCQTDYFIQMDEDMEFFPDSIATITANLVKTRKKMFMQYYYLIDTYLGISDPPVIIGLKVYKYSIMKNYAIDYAGAGSDSASSSSSEIVSSVDQMWQKKIGEDGFSCKQMPCPIGYHARHREPFDVLLRYCKMVKSLLDPRITAHRSDKPKIARAMDFFGIEHFNDIYLSVFNHFLFMKKTNVIDLPCSMDTFKKNNDVLLKYLSYIPAKTCEMYGMDTDYVQICPTNPYEEFYDGENITTKLAYLTYVPIGDNMENVINIYGIIGVINSLFENYQYSYEHYPFKIDEYFKNILRFKLALVLSDRVQYEQIKLQLTDINNGGVHPFLLDLHFFRPEQTIETPKEFDMIMNFKYDTRIETLLEIVHTAPRGKKSLQYLAYINYHGDI